MTGHIYYGTTPGRTGAPTYLKVGWTSDLRGRLLFHARDRYGWQTLGWHRATRKHEALEHAHLRQTFDWVAPRPTDREWYALERPSGTLLHYVHRNLTEVYRGGRLEPAFWDLWARTHARSEGRRGCTSGACALEAVR